MKNVDRSRRNIGTQSRSLPVARRCVGRHAMYAMHTRNEQERLVGEDIRTFLLRVSRTSDYRWC